MYMSRLRKMNTKILKDAKGTLLYINTHILVFDQKKNHNFSGKDLQMLRLNNLNERKFYIKKLKINEDICIC